MSDNNSNTENTRSAAAIRQDIAEYVLSHADELSDVPGVRQFVEEHGRLTTEIAEGEERLQRLEKAKTEYEPLENRVTACRKALKDAEAELAKSHRPLGTAAFKAFIAGDIEDHPVFADRLAAHNRVQELQQERDGLAPSADAGMAQKVKAKAQQLAVMAKIKIEEMKYGGLETKIGRKIVEDKLDESVRCDSTSDVLACLSKVRQSLGECVGDLEEQQAERDSTAKRLCETVPLESITGVSMLNAEYREQTDSLNEKRYSLNRSTDSLASHLRRVDDATIPESLRKHLAAHNEKDVALNMAGEHFQEAKRTLVDRLLSPVRRSLGSASEKWPQGSKSQQRKWKKWAVGGVCLIVAIAAMQAISEIRAMRQSVADAHSLWENGSTDEAIGRYKSILSKEKDGEFRAVSDDLPIILGRIIDVASASGNLTEARTFIEKSKEMEVQPTLSSDEARQLVKQIASEEAEERNRLAAEKTEERNQEEREQELVDSADDKVRAFRKLMDTWGDFDYKFASDKERKEHEFNINRASDEFSTIPFDPKVTPDHAKQIITIYEDRFEGRYSGPKADRMEAKIGDIFAELRKR